MSQQLIGRYLNELSDLRRVSGDVRESVVREAFKTLLKDWGRSKKLIFVPEYRLDTVTRDRRFVDGAQIVVDIGLPPGRRLRRKHAAPAEAGDAEIAGLDDAGRLLEADSSDLIPPGGNGGDPVAQAIVDHLAEG